jgi:hypothetical protein
MRHVTAVSFALAFVLGSVSALACPAHDTQTVSTPSPVVTADQGGPSTKIVIPSDG